MTNYIITEPTVCVVGTSSFNSGLVDFIHSEDLTEVASVTTTPLGALYAAVNTNERFSDAELLPEFAGRFCYRSWERGRPTEEYNRNILEMEHGSVLEHSYVNFTITGVSRALTHELIRHRVGVAISQESQRYVDADDINFVLPPLMLHFFGDSGAEVEDWSNENLRALEAYRSTQELLNLSLKDALASGKLDIDFDIDALAISQEEKVKKQFTRIKKRANEAARSLLPNAAETKLVWTANLRTLRHFIMLRGDDPADLEIRRLAVEVAKACKELAPTIFSDIEIIPGSFGVERVAGVYKKV